MGSQVFSANELQASWESMENDNMIMNDNDLVIVIWDDVILVNFL